MSVYKSVLNYEIATLLYVYEWDLYVSAYFLEYLLFISGFAEIWVSTNDSTVENIAQEEGVLVHKRSPETDTDEASSIFAIQEFLQYHPGSGI